MIVSNERHEHSTIQDIAVMYGVTAETARQWVVNGLIKSEYWEEAKPKYWISDEALQRFDDEYGDILRRTDICYTGNHGKGHLMRLRYNQLQQNEGGNQVTNEHKIDFDDDTNPLIDPIDDSVYDGLSSEPLGTTQSDDRDTISVSELNRRWYALSTATKARGDVMRTVVEFCKNLEFESATEIINALNKSTVYVNADRAFNEARKGFYDWLNDKGVSTELLASIGSDSLYQK